MEEKELNELVVKIESATAQKITDTVKESLKDLDTKAVNELLEKEIATKEDLDNVLKGEAFTNLETQMKEMIESVNQMKDNNQKSEIPKSFRESITKALNDNKDAIQALKNDRNAGVQIKAVGNITVANNTTGRVIRQDRDNVATGVARRNPFVLDIVNVGTTNAGVYYYVERTGHEGAPTMVAEGAVKPNADWDYIERSASAKKTAVIVTVSKEMLDDYDAMIQDVNDEIQEQINLLLDDQLLTGDGTGTNLEGIDANATAFAAGALAGTVDSAQKLDVLRAAVAQVHRQFFTPTYCVVHPDDAASLDLTKDATTGQYILAPFTSADNMQVSGVPIITNTNVTVDDFYCGDFTKFKVKVREGLTMDVGYRGAAGDWENNFVSFLGELRTASYIPENHFGAIVKGDFTSAEALLETP